MKGKLSTIAITSLLSMSAIAGSMGVPNNQENAAIIRAACAKVITLSLGPAWYNNSGDIQTNIFYPARVVHRYVPSEIDGVVGSGELFFGLARPINGSYSGQFGVAVAYSGNAKHSGFRYDGNPVVSQNAYSYRSNNTRIALKGKLISDWRYWAKPYISGSAGIGFNRSYDYYYAGQPLVPLFGEFTANGFSYTAGIGVQGNLSSAWQVGVGYEFSDWGKSHLSVPNFQTLNTPNLAYQGPHANSFYTHELQFSLSYFM